MRKHQSFKEIMELKEMARERQVRSIENASVEELEIAANNIKEVWRRSSIKRPQRFKDLFV